jgi:hypothetical protein
MADRDDKPRKSWREIDAQRDRARDRGSERKPDGPFGGGAKGEQRQQSYRAQLDRLFESGGIGKLVAEAEKQKAQAEAPPAPTGTPPASPSSSAQPPAAPATPPVDDSRQKKLAAVREAIGPDQITRAINAYLKAHAWPQELDFLSAALEHRDEDVVRESLARLVPALAGGKPRRAGMLAGRLRTLEELGSDPEIRAQAAALRRKL